MDHVKLLLFRLLSSLKFWTTIIGIVSTWLAKRGIIIGEDLAPYVAGFFGLLLAGQAAADHGKEKVKIEAAAQPGTVTTTTSASGDATTTVSPAGAPPPPSGFIAKDLLVILSAFAIATLLASVLLAACSQGVKQFGKAVAGDVVDCLKPDVKELVDQFGPTTEDLIRATLTQDGKVDREALKYAARGYATAKAQCVMASALTNLLAASSRPPDPNAPASEALKVDDADARAAAADVLGGARFKTANGEL